MDGFMSLTSSSPRIETHYSNRWARLSLACPWIQQQFERLTYSGISGSTLIFNSPKHFVAYYALPRLWVPSIALYRLSSRVGDKRNYSENLQEDKKIRDYIKNYIKINIRISSGVEGIAGIKIKKRIDLIQVIISMGFPKLLIEGKPGRIEELQMNLQKKLNCVNRKLNIAITRIANPYGHPNILAEFIAGQLRNRVSFRKAMKKAIELTQQAGTKGIQVQIAGRIDGKEIARVEWIREGRVPLQTIRAKIDYCSYTVRTIYGVLGIKVWIFVNKE
ncbi:30S ribosomal protein S3, chloroplastic-like [Arachis stenosperma]|uniref:30S ribosomal protein S3, chloroplastic-like n=1 Tax=Arachis stenosperma TaxID=217475 RepID=UPI0025ACF2FC|nr:30S ribosomal protein S3, chloroplastic-like [Arachis stenosperma]